MALHASRHLCQLRKPLTVRWGQKGASFSSQMKNSLLLRTLLHAHFPSIWIAPVQWSLCLLGLNNAGAHTAHCKLGPQSWGPGLSQVPDAFLPQFYICARLDSLLMPRVNHQSPAEHMQGQTGDSRCLPLCGPNRFANVSGNITLLISVSILENGY